MEFRLRGMGRFAGGLLESDLHFIYLADVCTTKEGSECFEAKINQKALLGVPATDDGTCPLEAAIQLGGDVWTNGVTTGELLYSLRLLSRFMKNVLN